MAQRLRVTRRQAVRLIAGQIKRGIEILKMESRVLDESDLNAFKGEYQAWHEFNKGLLRRIFGGRVVLRGYIRARTHVPPSKWRADLYERRERTAGFLASKIRQLESTKGHLAFFDEPAAKASRKRGAVSKRPGLKHLSSLYRVRDAMRATYVATVEAITKVWTRP